LPLLRSEAAAHAGTSFTENWLRGWRERRFAAERCKSLRNLHDQLRTSSPELQGDALYLAILANSTGSDAVTVQDLLESARESYAEWPVHRSLRLRDIAHRLIVWECCSHHPDQPWLQATVKEVVDNGIPSQL
jgi:hypothetical protein